MKTLSITFLLGLILVHSIPAHAERGREIAEEMDRRDSGYGDYRANVTMLIVSPDGTKTKRLMQIQALEQTDDGDKLLIRFSSPPDVRGTTLLTYSHVDRSDDQWIFLPALNRVKRIASRNKSGPFLGSEFAYEDLSSYEVDKYRYRYLREEPCDDTQCYVLERVPLDQYSGYSRQLVWIDQPAYRQRKIVFFDRHGKRLKTLTFSDYVQYAGRFWRARTLHMVNHQRHRETYLYWRDYRFHNGLRPRDFTRTAIKR